MCNSVVCWDFEHKQIEESVENPLLNQASFKKMLNIS